jgi:hypothetical protein
MKVLISVSGSSDFRVQKRVANCFAAPHITTRDLENYRMKRFPTVLVLTALCASFIGCEKAKDAAQTASEQARSASAADLGKEMTDKAKDAVKDAVEKSGVADALTKAKDALASVEGGSDMLEKVQGSFGSLSKLLGDIKDEASANGAVSELNKLTESFGGMTELFGKLPESAKGMVSQLFESSMSDIKPIIDKVMAIPGVEAIIKPAVEALMAKLNEFKA